jgi:hypothetical protein
MVDTVEVSVIPVLLGGGVHVAPNLSRWIHLSSFNHKVYSSGAVLLEYAIRGSDPHGQSAAFTNRVPDGRPLFHYLPVIEGLLVIRPQPNRGLKNRQ